MTTKDTRTLLKERVAAVKPHLPKNWRKLVFEKMPELNTHTGSTLLTNVLAGRSTDYRITEVLESIVEVVNQLPWEKL